MLLLTAAMCAGTIIVALVWIAITAVAARARLQQAQADLPKFRDALLSGDVGRARALADDIRSNADSAHNLVSGPAWWVAANLPSVGTPLATARTIATAVHDIGDDILPGVVDLGAMVYGSSLHSGTSIHLAPLASAATVVTRGHITAADALARVRATSASSWLSSIDKTRHSLLTRLSTLDADLSGASRALHLMLPMMGESGPRRYFVGFENEAEARGLGGIPGAFAIVTVEHGNFQFTHFGNDNALRHVPSHVELGADYDARYGSADPAATFANSDIGPDFRDAARIWAGMWQTKSGQHIDGAIAIDPTALSYLLQVTGPTRLPSGGLLTGDNVVALTQQTQYAMFPVDAARKRYIVGVAKAVADGVTSGRGSASALLRAFTRAAHERRMAIWSAKPGEEANLIAAGYSAILRSDGAPFTGFAVVNSTGNKLDYYLDRSMTYTRPTCHAGVTATATLTLTNNAPRSGLSPYVTQRADQPSYPTKPGDNHVIVTYYGTPGAQVLSAKVDKKTIGVVVGSEHGLLTVSTDVELAVARPVTIAVTLREPAAHRATQVFRQPLVRSPSVFIATPSCS